MATDRPHHERLDVHGAGGERGTRHRRGGLVAGVAGRVPGRRGPSPLVASLAAQLSEFGAAVRGRPAPGLATAADGHATMVVIDAARSSARAGGRPVRIVEAADR